MNLTTLSGHDMQLSLSPDQGASLTCFKWRNQHILRPLNITEDQDEFDPVQSAAFVMVPFIGRIAQGRFDYQGRQISLPANLPPEPHAIHGHGWQAVWQIEAQADTALSLLYYHPADAWPWTYQARQHFTLMPGGLRLALEVTNLSDKPMPAGLGWHPYFPRSEARLSLPVTACWPSGDDQLQAPPQPLKQHEKKLQGGKVSGMELDNCFDLVQGQFCLDWPDYRLKMIPDPVFSKATIYVPRGQDYFCVEPVSHAPNAINSALPPSQTGLQWLGRGETMRGSVELWLSSKTGAG